MCNRAPTNLEAVALLREFNFVLQSVLIWQAVTSHIVKGGDVNRGLWRYIDCGYETVGGILANYCLICSGYLKNPKKMLSLTLTWCMSRVWVWVRGGQEVNHKQLYFPIAKLCNISFPCLALNQWTHEKLWLTLFNVQTEYLPNNCFYAGCFDNKNMIGPYTFLRCPLLLIA